MPYLRNEAEGRDLILAIRLTQTLFHLHACAMKGTTLLSSKTGQQRYLPRLSDAARPHGAFDGLALQPRQRGDSLLPGRLRHHAVDRYAHLSDPVVSCHPSAVICAQQHHFPNESEGGKPLALLYLPRGRMASKNQGPLAWA
jgi:hypothetical protein